jgi:hypothetical protein
MRTGQIDLFTKRVRGLPPPKEFLLHVALADTLRIATLEPWWWTHLPFGEKRDKVTAGRLQRMGVRGGLPDFIFIGHGFAFLELKRKGERPSEEQWDVGRRLLHAGADWLVTDDLKDAIGWLKDLGIVRARVSA